MDSSGVILIKLPLLLGSKVGYQFFNGGRGRCVVGAGGRFCYRCDECVWIILATAFEIAEACGDVCDFMRLLRSIFWLLEWTKVCECSAGEGEE